MTPDDARRHWCPLTRVALNEGMAANWSDAMDKSGKGYGNIHDETRCKAGECMLWRWNWRAGDQRQTMQSDATLTMTTDDGYCGLGPRY